MDGGVTALSAAKEAPLDEGCHVIAPGTCRVRTVIHNGRECVLPQPRLLQTAAPFGVSQSFAKFREKFASGAAGAEISKGSRRGCNGDGGALASAGQLDYHRYYALLARLCTTMQGANRQISERRPPNRGNSACID